MHRYIGFRQGQVFLASVVGAMGSGMPMAVAAALRRPNTQVVAFVGDGGALMTGNEIATAVQYGANPIMVISDNGMYGTIGMHSYMRYPERPLMDGVRLTNPDFAQWARSFGAEARHDRERGRDRRRHRPRLRGQDQAGRRPLPHLAAPDERLAPLHPVGDIAVAAFRSKAPAPNDPQTASVTGSAIPCRRGIYPATNGTVAIQLWPGTAPRRKKSVTLPGTARLW